MKKIIRFFFFSLFLLQLCIIIYFNFNDIKSGLDPDFANTIYHYREVIKNKTINLPDWNHTTSLELDGVFAFAIPVYFITRDVFTAVGIGNVITVLLYCITIWKLLEILKIDRLYRYMAMTLVITPYSFGMLEYFNMLFYGGSCYSIRVLIPLIGIICLMGCEKKEKTLPWMILYFVLLAISVFSVGLYIILCGVFPVIAGLCIIVWNQGSIKTISLEQTIYLIIHVPVVAISYYFHKVIYGMPSRMTLPITRTENIWVNFRACISGIFQVLGATPSEEIILLSKAGIYLACKIALVFIIMIALICLLIGKIKLTNDKKIKVGLYLCLLFAINFMVLLIADTRFGDNTHIEYRYWIMGVVPLMILSVIVLESMLNNRNLFQQCSLTLGLLLWMAIMVIGNSWNVKESKHNSEYAVELTDFFQTLDVESVLFVNDRDTFNICRGIDENHIYGNFLSDSQTYQVTICSYNASSQREFYGNNNALAVFLYTEPKDYMPEEEAAQYQKVGTVRWFDIYINTAGK